MHIEFTATTLFAENEMDVAYFSLMDGEGEEPENILIFQTLLPSTGETGSIHLEYNDQSNGNYGCIAQCLFGRERLQVNLSRQLGELDGVEGFIVHLALDEATYHELHQALTQLFANGPLLQLMQSE